MESTKKIVLIAIIVIAATFVLYAASRIFFYGIAVLGGMVYGMDVPAFTLFTTIH